MTSSLAKLRWKRLPKNIVWLTQLVALVLFAWGAIISIVELNARNSYSIMLSQRRERVLQKLVARDPTPQATPPSPTSDAIQSITEPLDAINRSEDRLLFLCLYGTSRSDSLLESLIETDVAGSSADATSSLLRNFIGGRIAFFSSNLITALLIISCGAVGALVAGFRDERPTTFRDLCLGFSSGFICFLGIRGGQDVFLLQTRQEFMPVNPFSSGLAGLLAGLFSDRFYALIRQITDSLSTRIRRVIDDSETAGGNRTDAVVPNSHHKTSEL